MTDVVDPKTRSRMMASIRSTNTKPEVLLRQALHAEGFRFRINVRGLPGSPDIVLPKWKAAVQVHGCFWHRHSGCPKATTPASNVDFWTKKFAVNVQRDARAIVELRALGWRTAIVWECAIRKWPRAELVRQLSGFIRNQAITHCEWSGFPSASGLHIETGPDDEMAHCRGASRANLDRQSSVAIETSGASKSPLDG